MRRVRHSDATFDRVGWSPLGSRRVPGNPYLRRALPRIETSRCTEMRARRGDSFVGSNKRHMLPRRMDEVADLKTS